MSDYRSMAPLYGHWSNVAQDLNRPTAAAKLRFLKAWCRWREARENLRMVNGNRRLQGMAMRAVNRHGRAMGEAYREVR